jgi:hypothetical protein
VGFKVYDIEKNTADSKDIIYIHVCALLHSALTNLYAMYIQNESLQLRA